MYIIVLLTKYSLLKAILSLDLGEGRPQPGVQRQVPWLQRRPRHQVRAAGEGAGGAVWAALLRPGQQRDGGPAGGDRLPALQSQAQPGGLHGEQTARSEHKWWKFKLLRRFDSVMSSNAPETKTIRVNCLTIKLYGICLEFICCVLVLLGLCGFWFDVLFNLTIWGRAASHIRHEARAHSQVFCY